MLPLRTLSLLPVWLISFMLSSHLCAQLQAANKVQTQTSFFPWNAKKTDSLQRLNHFHTIANRVIVPAQQQMKIHSGNINPDREVLSHTPINKSSSVNFRNSQNTSTSAVCSVISGRDFVYQDSLVFYRRSKLYSRWQRVAQLEDGYYNQSYVDATAINKTNGDTLFSKHFSQTGDPYAARLYNTFEVVKLNNGHFRMSGPTTLIL